MKLDQTTIDFIEKVTKIASIVDIGNVIISQDQVRAVDESKTVVILHNQQIPTLSFDAIAIPRVKDFVSRWDIVKSQNKFTVSTVEDQNNGFIRSLTLKGEGTKLEFHCARPTHIKAPKQLNDTMKVDIPLGNGTIEMLSKASTAMKAETVKIICDGQQVSFELKDVSSDTFNYTISDQFTTIDDQSDVQFENVYQIKSLLSLFKQNSTGTFQVGNKGTLQVCANDIDTFVIPQIER